MQNESGMPIGLRIKSLRKAKSLTQKDFARNGISPAYLSLIENGHRQPTKSALVKISQILGIDLEEVSDKSQDSLTPPLRDLVFATQLAISNNNLNQAEELLAQFPAEAENTISYLLLRAALDCELGNFLSGHEIVNQLVSQRFSSATLSQKMEIATLYGETADHLGLGIIPIVELLRIQENCKTEARELRILLCCLVAARLDDAGYPSEAAAQLKDAEELLGKKPDSNLERNVYWTASNVALNAGDYLGAAELAKSAIRTLTGAENSVNNLQISLLEIQLKSPDTTSEEFTKGLDTLRTWQTEIISKSEYSSYLPKIKILEIGFLMKLHKFDEAATVTHSADKMDLMSPSEFTKLQILKAEIAAHAGEKVSCAELCINAATFLSSQPRNRRNDELWKSIKRISLRLEDDKLLIWITSLEISQESQIRNFTNNSHL